MGGSRLALLIFFASHRGLSQKEIDVVRISVIAHSACREDEQAGRLAVVPLEKPGMVRRINMVHHQDFSHPEILEELRRLYIGRR